MSATAAHPVTIASSGSVYTQQPGNVTYTQPTVTYAQPGAVTYSQPGAVTYTQPTVTYAQPTQPTVTYAQPGSMTSQPQVIYANTAPAVSAAPQTYTYAQQPQQPQEPTGGVVYAAPQIVSNYAGVPPAYVQSVQNPQFPAAQSMLVYPGMAAPYMPTSVQSAWDNHFDAFGKQDLDKIMLDYDEASVARVYDWTKATETTFTGVAEIRGMFSNLFAKLSDLSTLDAPVVKVEEFPKTVFLCWKCPGCDVLSATDTFVFGDNFKIQRQNIVLSAGGSAPGPAVTSAATAAASSAKTAKAGSSSSKKMSSKKNLSSKKKTSKGCC